MDILEEIRPRVHRLRASGSRNPCGLSAACLRPLRDGPIRCLQQPGMWRSNAEMSREFDSLLTSDIV